MPELDDRSIRSAGRRTAMAVFAVIIATGLGIAYGQEQGLRQESTGHASGSFESTTRAPSAIQGPRTLFTVDGTAVHIWSPVQPPYSNSAYQNLGGQPMGSGDSILSPKALNPGD